LRSFSTFGIADSYLWAEAKSDSPNLADAFGALINPQIFNPMKRKLNLLFWGEKNGASNLQELILVCPQIKNRKTIHKILRPYKSSKPLRQIKEK
jgi:hypothetical protein